MAAGLGFKTFTTGEVLTAADTNGYLMQGINVFASTAARDAAITSPQEGQFAFTKDTNGLWYYDGAAWVASGATGDIEGVTAGIGISGGGTSGTVTVTNSMATAIDAKGDLIGGTGADTFARLAIGANDTVLTADSAQATGLKWATPSSGAMTLISTTSFTSVASQAFDGVFSSTYKSYIVYCQSIFGTANNSLRMQLRIAGPTTVTAAYHNGWIAGQPTGTVLNVGNNNAAFAQVSDTYGASAAFGISGQFNFLGCSGVSAVPTVTYQTSNGYSVTSTNGGFAIGGADTFTGFILTGSAGNLTGTVHIFGVK